MKGKSETFKKVKGEDLKEGMQFVLNGKEYDVLMGANYYGHPYLCVVVYDHTTEKEKYKRISENKRYDVFSD